MLVVQSVFGQFNLRKEGSPWRDVRLRQVANFAINRADLIRYATKGNGVIIPALVPVHAFGYDPNLASYPFDADKARGLLREAGYTDGLVVTLIAPEDLVVQATVVSKMLEQVGFTVELQVLDAAAYNRKRHTHDQAYFLFLYNPIRLYAVNKAVEFVPYVANLSLAETSVTDQHWSVRK